MNYIELHSEIPTVISTIKLIGSHIISLNIADPSTIYTPDAITTSSIILAQTFTATAPSIELEVSFLETRTGAPNADLLVRLVELTGGLPDLNKTLASAAAPISSLTPNTWNTLPILQNFVLITGVQYAILFSLTNFVLIDASNNTAVNRNTDVTLPYPEGTSYISTNGGTIWGQAGGSASDDYMLRIRHSSGTLSPDTLEVNGISGVGVGALMRVDEPMTSLGDLFIGVTGITKYCINGAEVGTEQEVLDGLNDGFVSSVYVEGALATTVGLALDGFVGCWYITNQRFKFTDFLEVTNNTLWFNPHIKDHKKYNHYYPMNQLINTDEVEDFIGAVNAITTSSVFWSLDQLRLPTLNNNLLLNTFDTLTINTVDTLQLGAL